MKVRSVIPFILGAVFVIAIGLVTKEILTDYKIKSFVAQHLNDPDSAKFGQITRDNDGFMTCVEVNGKNRFGGYVGKQSVAVVLSPTDDKLNMFSGFGQKMSHADCVNLYIRVK